ncbi:hypothetical protein M3172_16120 [Mesobacillus subterraneus]|uniref:hypothetical protein n=1 Tax=Mesobacillus subterraneus TaxID=285983 RepID=UPI00203B1622|nr:hypothetical protein [Mesobacillus subterraneus]MCM3574724.1 hypothetical protein [Mesobacillus subterraneus]
MRRLIWIFIILTLTSCSDPSPIKSDIEVRYNELFGTKFGVVDQVYISSEGKQLAFLGSKEFLGYLEDVEEVGLDKYNKDLTITLKTSDEMKEYSKEQTSAELYYDIDKNILCSDKSCYKVSRQFEEQINSYSER